MFNCAGSATFNHEARVQRTHLQLLRHLANLSDIPVILDHCPLRCRVQIWFKIIENIGKVGQF